MELRQSGFRVEQMVGDLTGIPLHRKEGLIGVIATVGPGVEKSKAKFEDTSDPVLDNF